MFEKKHCKKHKKDGEKGRPPPWSKRYQDILKILGLVFYTLNISEKEWLEGTMKEHKKFKPKITCSKGHLVTDTCIENFVNGSRRCFKCNGNIPWSGRYEEFKELCKKNGYELSTTEEEWKEGTKEESKKFKPKITCPRGHPVTDTCIGSFVNGYNKGNICSKCSGLIPWSGRYEEFKELCKKNGYELSTTEEEWKEGTKKEKQKFKPKIKCTKGHPMTDTSINSFGNGTRCPDCKQSRSEKMMTEMVEKLYPENIWTKTRPDFLKYNKGRNLELDLYCVELNLAFEYDGRQHRTYIPHFHKTEQEFEELQKRDIWKDKMCEEQGIKLIRIPDKIDEIYIDCNNPDNMENYIKCSL
jgi:very-short-patch-repair endonuclease